MTLASILEPVAAWFPNCFWQYLDDVRFASRDPFFLQYALLFAKHLIVNARLYVGNKSSDCHALVIIWLGKTVSGTGTGIKTSPSSLATVSSIYGCFAALC